MINAEQILLEKKGDLLSISRDTTVEEALKLMTERGIGAIVVKEGNAYIGIWTERDLMRNVLQDGFNIKTAKVSEYMSTDLKYCDHKETAYQLQDKFLGLRIRHLLVRKGDECIGVLSTGDIMKTILNTKEKELKSMNAMIGWEYYENWRWGP
ncbi:MAG: CBS domain-containing protein [Myxococcota bacterium]|nr:CBS domain-containing protein [Myxococcota bacterium]